MRSKPVLINIVAAMLLFLPAAIFAFMAQRTGDLSTLPTTLWSELALLSALSWTAAYGVWRVRLWGYYAFLGFLMAIIGLDIYHLYEDPSKTWQAYIFDLIVVLAGFWVFQRRNIHEPYFTPQLRWWERASRYKTDILSKIYTTVGTFEGHVLDLSESGCFIDCDLPLEVGSTSEIFIEWEGCEFHCRATLVRASEFPRGMGFRFDIVEKSQIQQVATIIRKLRQNSKKSA